MVKNPDYNPDKITKIFLKNKPDCNPAFLKIFKCHFTIQAGW